MNSNCAVFGCTITNRYTTMDTKALRQKILDLAIHGKLVPQDPNDEPASVLLERIKAEKERLIKEGKIKRSKKSAKTSDTPHYENVPFELPNSWVWCRLEDIAYVASGSTPDKTCFVENGVPYIKMYNLRNQKIDFAYHPQYITEEVHNGKLQRSRTEVGDLIMNIVGPPLGKLAIIPTTLPQANFNQAAVLIRPYKFKEVLVSYLKVYLEEMSEINSIATRGSAGQVNISLTQSQNMRIPIPPLNEVRRIIEEVSKYDILIDSLKQNITDIQNLIAYTKSKILDLAIHGKLVPQDPNDEPAIELLKRINPDFTPCDNGHYTNLPKGWAICKLSDLCRIENGFAFSSNDYKSQGIPLVRISNITHNTIDITDCVYVEGITDNKFKISKGDLLIAMSGATTGKMGVYLFDEIAYLNQRVGNIKILNKSSLFPDYRNIYMQSKVDEILKIAYGGAQPNISASVIGNFDFPLPPYKEQIRIVETVQRIFDQLDTITESL